MRTSKKGHISATAAAELLIEAGDICIPPEDRPRLGRRVRNEYI
jgi:hypothetical protein